jgi:hypothetical protein
MDDHRIVSVDAQHADLEQIAVAGGTDAHREVFIELSLDDGVADGVRHIFVGDAMLSGGLRVAHGMTRYLVKPALVKEPCRQALGAKTSRKTANRPRTARKRL